MMPEISIHALLAESDDTRHGRAGAAGNFYPRSPCGERHYIAIRQAFSYTISIHALLAESDVWPGLLARPFFIISIHALLAESDPRGGKLLS